MARPDPFELATGRAKQRQAALPTAVAAHYDHRTGRIVIRLSSKVEVAFSPRDAEGLEHSSPSELDDIDITPSGFGIHFPKLNADLYLPALLEGLLGSKRWISARLGRVGGKSQTATKAPAPQRNGRLRVRPKKVAAPKLM